MSPAAVSGNPVGVLGSEGGRVRVLDRAADEDRDRGIDADLPVATGGDRRAEIVIISATSITATATTTKTILATSSTAKRSVNDEIKSVVGAGAVTGRSDEGVEIVAGNGSGAAVGIGAVEGAVARVATGAETGRRGGDAREGRRKGQPYARSRERNSIVSFT